MAANGNRRRTEIDSWFALIARIVAFFLGAAILAGQAFFFQPYFPLVLAGVACLGPVVAHTLASVVMAFQGRIPEKEQT